tara:strand:+ start:284 stop:1024 length:741 start_codon:yes stop_codon:yes gene_type:complete
MTFTSIEIVFISLIFIWIGFVRTGLGFGGAVLGLPLLMLVGGSPIDWLPIIGIHLLFFSGIALINATKSIDWDYLKNSLPWILPAKIIGVIGLISLPPNLMIVIVYSITTFYAFTWILNFQIASREGWVSRILLILGGYISGTSLNGAPLLVAVYMQNIDHKRLRNTLFVLWFLLVVIKMTAFLIVDVFINWHFSLMLIPVAALGHFVGLKVHNRIIENDTQFKRWMGSVLILICSAGLSKVLFYA